MALNTVVYSGMFRGGGYYFFDRMAHKAIRPAPCCHSSVFEALRRMATRAGGKGLVANVGVDIKARVAGGTITGTRK